MHTQEPEQLGERRVTISREGTTAYLKLGYHAPGIDDPDFFPMLVLDAILTGAKGLNLWASFRTPPPQRSARLYRALVNTGLASSVTGGLVPTQQPFLYTISVTATDGTPLAGARGRDAPGDRSRPRRGRHARTRCEQAKNQLRARLVFENDSITNIAHQLGYFETIASWRLVASLRERIDAVTLDAVGAAAVGAARRPPTARSAGSSRSRSPDVHDPATRARRPSARSSTTATVVIAKHSPATPAVTVHASFAAGSIFDPPGRSGLAHFVSKTIDRGTTTRTADDIAEELENRGVSLAVSVNRHALQLVLTCLVEDLETVLAILADIVMDPTFPEADVQTKRGEIITLIRQDEDNPAAVSGEAMLTALYGDDASLRVAAARLGRERRGDRRAPRCRRSTRARFAPSTLSLVMVGDVDPGTRSRRRERAFGELARDGRTAAWTCREPPPTAGARGAESSR